MDKAFPGSAPVPGASGPKGWHSRGYLPHFDGECATQSINIHLADSLPGVAVERLRRELSQLPEVERELERRKRIEALLDKGHGEALLRRPELAEILQAALLFFDGERYALHSWVVMPNHAHVLFTSEPGISLGRILGSWKSYTSHRINEVAGRAGQLWAEDYFDRFIRSEQHYRNAVSYIENNPVKARLCHVAEDWPWSSARLR